MKVAQDVPQEGLELPQSAGIDFRAAVVTTNATVAVL